MAKNPLSRGASGLPRGRRSKLTPETHAKIVAAVQGGNYTHTASEYAGIHPSTYFDWMQKGERSTSGKYRELYEAVKLAESESEMRAVITVQKCIKDGDWKAAMTYLERKYPNKWGRRERHEVSGPGGGPIEVRASLMHQLIREAEASGGFEPEVVDDHLNIASMDEEAYASGEFIGGPDDQDRPE